MPQGPRPPEETRAPRAPVGTGGWRAGSRAGAQLGQTRGHRYSARLHTSRVCFRI